MIANNYPLINHNIRIFLKSGINSPYEIFSKINLSTTQRGTIIMTKIKNTKKGMAKKTLSMSLVVAMLATSNVPVWAAEFSDGSDADVAITSEAPVAEDTDAADAAAFSDEATPEVTENTDDIADTATAATEKALYFEKAEIGKPV